MPYPVSVRVEPTLANRNRLTTGFRLILAIPHLVVVGGVGVSHGGLLGTAVVFLAIVSWFTIVVVGRHIVGIRQLTAFFMRWRVCALAYLMLLADEYPPFGDAPYPASIEISDPTGPRDRFTVALRLFLVIPHGVVLLFVLLAWHLVTVAAWFIILFVTVQVVRRFCSSDATA